MAVTVADAVTNRRLFLSAVHTVVPSFLFFWSSLQCTIVCRPRPLKLFFFFHLDCCDEDSSSFFYRLDRLSITSRHVTLLLLLVRQQSNHALSTCEATNQYDESVHCCFAYQSTQLCKAKTANVRNESPNPSPFASSHRAVRSAVDVRIAGHQQTLSFPFSTGYLFIF